MHVIEPDVSAVDEAAESCVPLIDTHEMHPDRVLRLVHSLGGSLERIVLVGCEPSPADDYEEMQPGLSEAVREAIPSAIELILRIVAEWNGVAPARGLSTSNSRDDSSLP